MFDRPKSEAVFQQVNQGQFVHFSQVCVLVKYSVCVRATAFLTRPNSKENQMNVKSYRSWAHLKILTVFSGL